ncbi:MAG: class I SAM-dependent methyltransferase, partial [Myxococcota bacterium]
MNESATVNLDGVPETMLWTLYNRAGEAMRDDAQLDDPDAVRIYRTIEYDYSRSFGKSNASHAIRSLAFDRAVRPWMAEHPGATVIELACGLETQFQRVDDGA